MRKLLLGAAAISLSGCSFLGIGGHSSYQGYQPAPVYGGGYANAGSACAPSHAVVGQGRCLSRINVEGGIGLSVNTGSTIFEGTNAAGLGAGDSLRDVDFSEAYEVGRRAEAGLSYALDPVTKITAMGFIEDSNSAGEVNFGTIGGQSLTGTLSDYEARGVELGVRRYFAPSPVPVVRSVRPYVEARVGATRVDDITLNDAELGGVAVPGAFALYDGGWIPSAAGLIGFETPVAERTTLGIETGLRYVGRPDRDNTNLATIAGGDLEGVNDAGARLSVPVMLRGRFRF
ncbi:MAG: hypothetical protein WBG08_10045 [Litorimonas sp.]